MDLGRLTSAAMRACSRASASLRWCHSAATALSTLSSRSISCSNTEPCSRRSARSGRGAARCPSNAPVPGSAARSGPCAPSRAGGHAGRPKTCGWRNHRRTPSSAAGMGRTSGPKQQAQDAIGGRRESRRADLRQQQSSHLSAIWLSFAAGPGPFRCAADGEVGTEEIPARGTMLAEPPSSLSMRSEGRSLPETLSLRPSSLAR